MVRNNSHGGKEGLPVVRSRLRRVNEAERDILTLYRNDIIKFGGSSKHNILVVEFVGIPRNRCKSPCPDYQLNITMMSRFLLPRR